MVSIPTQFWFEKKSQYGILQFNKYEEIQSKGYRAALDMLEKWDEEGKLSTILDGFSEVRIQARKKGRSVRRNSI